jgi:hypothetical protein
VEPIRQARAPTPVSLFEMDREQAQSERDRMADEHPEATWLVAEQQPGDWAVVKVGLTPADADLDSSTEARPKPDHAEDPRPVTQQLVPPWSAGG